MLSLLHEIRHEWIYEAIKDAQFPLETLKFWII